MRIAMVAVAGTVVGLLGGTGWGALHARDALVAAHLRDKAVEETAGAPPEEPAGDPVDASLAPDEAGVELVPDGTETTATAAAPSEGSVAEAEAIAGADAQGFDAEGARRLGKIFAAMKPVEAAGVLSQMPDAEAAAVLVQMSDRQAAPILASIPVERAALLGRLVLAGRGVSR